MASKQANSYIIAGGGTGGHIYPALAIADALKKMDPAATIHFVGTSKGLETTLVPRAGYELHLLPVSGIKNLSLFQKIFAVAQIPFAFIIAVGLILKLKPKAVLGVGGYASGPMVLVASLMGRRTEIFEPNAVPGLTNKWLSHFVQKCFVTSDAAAVNFPANKVVSAGMPLRGGLDWHPRELHPELRILVTGGSQGAKAINEVVSLAVERGGDWLQGLALVHQTGAGDFERVKKRYEKSKIGLEVHAFLHDMPVRMAWADVVIGRSGAGTVAELAAMAKAAVLVPFPFAADNHQQKNAEVLERAGACVMILQKDLTVERLISLLKEFKSDRKKIEGLESKILAFHKPGSASMIAGHMVGR